MKLSTAFRWLSDCKVFVPKHRYIQVLPMNHFSTYVHTWICAKAAHYTNLQDYAAIKTA